MALVMATNMTIGMTLVMRWRRHGWRACAEMAAAMYLPFVVLFVPLWAGLLSPGGLMLWGHVLMLVAMAGAMALRPSEYAHC
jgi:peptidoglycan/LPS O-acetylase OafA/YrhL